MQISKGESNALEILKTNNLEVFSIKDLKLLLSLKPTKVYNLIKSLKNKGFIEVIRKGLYCIRGTDEMIIASRIVYPSYISFLSALNYYELTEQVSKKITLATTKRKKHKDYAFATLSKDKFFGYTHIDKIIISEKEKALIDSLYLPRYAGGIKTIITCFTKKLNKKKLYEYAMRMKSKAVIRRLGYILDYLHIEFKFNLRKKIGKGYELLEPSKERKYKYDKKWMLDVNI
ncbi:MAG: hypothetical protein KKF46_00870 [Nanoarchaeota archaeon]|nr:hypothetical protein [Nanoarchaeota archaeon]MBU1320886.1 hypothetical protein [Nanoarchaeota archaeon]MBU1597792.1 hypothetical protein [Nanoarchaeota archaeon]MBU2441243.1 hypothetical protein [Nanoarchaeota archaeon]